MGNVKLIIAILIVLALIGGVVGGFWYIQTNSAQATVLQEEMTKLAELDFINDDIDMEIKSTGNYGKVEEVVKEYIQNVKTTYNELKNYGNNEELSTIFSVENIEADQKELTVVSQKIAEYKNNLETLENKAFGISSEAKILEAIESKNIKSNYIDVYTNIMQNDVIVAKLQNVEQKMDDVKLKAEEKIEDIEKVVNFLKENAKYWSIKDGKLQFTNVNKLGEYYQLLNGAESK